MSIPYLNRILLLIKSFALTLLFFSLINTKTYSQSIFGRYDYVLKFYNVDEKKVDISKEIILNLNQDSTYSYLLHDQQMKATDTGTFKVKKDTIYFQSIYPKGPMHSRYDLFINDGIFHDENFLPEVEEIDTTQWYYIKITSSEKLPSGFHLKTNAFQYILNDTLNRYEICLPKNLVEIEDIKNFEIFFPDLNLVMNGAGQNKYYDFSHAIDIRLSENEEDLSKDLFFTPKTLHNIKMVIRCDKLFFIKLNEEIYVDIVFARYH